MCVFSGRGKEEDRKRGREEEREMIRENGFEERYGQRKRRKET